MLHHDLSRLARARWDDLTEQQPDETKTYMERHADDPWVVLTEWIDHGTLHLDFSRDKEFMEMIDLYVAEREKLIMDRAIRSNYHDGWHFSTSYLVCPSMTYLGLCRHICFYLSKIFNEQPLLHLALTGWVSTQRNWHQDSYLNPPNVWSSYAAAWIALDDIDIDSGPFEYVPGSHRWEVLRRERLFAHLDHATTLDPNWPTITQEHVSYVCEEKIAMMGAKRKLFVPRKGQVLLWHSNLIHRGTVPRNHELLRKSLILHYSGYSKRIDMEPKVRHAHGFYFQGPTDGSVRMM